MACPTMVAYLFGWEECPKYMEATRLYLWRNAICAGHRQ